MARIEGTDIDLHFIDKPAGGHAPIFYGPSEGTLRLASLNAGNSEGLYVGGGGINGGFGHVLSRTQTIGLYAARHQELLGDAAESGKATKRYADDDPTAFSCVYAAKVTEKDGTHEGVAFVDVFAPGRCPAENARNAAMLYVAPPYGGHYADDAAFLDAIRRTGKNIATAIARYNAIAPAERLPAIEALRLCLYSSVIYNPGGVPLERIARAIFDGVSRRLAAEASGLRELQLPVSADSSDPLFTAVKARYDP